MKKSIPALLALFILFSFTMPALAQDDMDMDEAPSVSDGAKAPEMTMCGPGCECPKCMGKTGMMRGNSPMCGDCMSKRGMMHGKGCMCERCMANKGMMRGMAGPDGMYGGMDSMTWPPMEKSCMTPDFYLVNRDILGLSDYQVDAIFKLHKELRKKKIVKGAQVKALEMELSDIVTTPDFKVSDALAKLAEIEKARTELRTLVIKASAEARDGLSPQQLEMLRGISLPRALPGKAGMAGERTGGQMKEMMKQKMREQMMEKNMP